MKLQKKINVARYDNNTTMVILVAVAAILLASCGCAANAQPTSPAQVAAAVAAATGTGEHPFVVAVPSSSSVNSTEADSVNQSSTAAVPPASESQLSAVAAAVTDVDNYKVSFQNRGK